jgi:hypothetical protein
MLILRLLSRFVFGRNAVRVSACITAVISNVLRMFLSTGCFKKSFTWLKDYINLFRGHVLFQRCKALFETPYISM